MSSRKMKAARKRVEPIAAQTQAEQWAAFRFPVWMRIVGVFIPSIKTKYQQNFERRLSSAIHITTKTVAHKVARRTA